VTLEVCLAEKVGFVPAIRSPINELGLFRSPQSTTSTQSLSIKYSAIAAPQVLNASFLTACTVQNMSRSEVLFNRDFHGRPRELGQPGGCLVRADGRRNLDRCRI